MTTWVTTPAEGNRLYSGVSLRLLDELTNQAPLGCVKALLDIQASDGTWRTTDIQDTRSPSSVVSYPWLERHAVVTGLQPQQYRVRLTADYYIPYYQLNSDGIAFKAYPYNDANPPTQFALIPSDTPLLPATNYPFANYIPVLRGVVVDSTRKLVANAYVTQGNTERALTDPSGNFALPLRWVQSGTTIPIDAADQRTGRSGSIDISFPTAISRSQTISIS